MFTDSGVLLGASSASDAWVFTFTRSAVGASFVVAWHWTGHGWRSDRLPAGVTSAAVFSPTNAWAFGSVGAGVPYVIRYNGRVWRRVSAPAVRIASISAVNSRDIWAVGRAAIGHKAGGFEAAHWNGASWRIVKLPRLRLPTGRSAVFPQILARGPANFWIDLDLASRSGQSPDGLALLHYDAGRWTQMAGPVRSVFESSNMSGDGHSGIWLAIARPQQGAGSAAYDYRNGQWSERALPVKAGHYALILSLARIPGSGMIWAAGYTGRAKLGSRSSGVLYAYKP